MYRLSVQQTVALADLSNMDADAHLDLTLGVGGVVLVMCTLDASGAADRRQRGRKGQEKPVTEELALLTTPPADLIPDDRSVQSQNLIDEPVPAGSPEGGGAFHIGHHDRERRGRGAGIGHESASSADLQQD